ncbi:MAG: HTTM domain-containing protein [Akkermansiaceae bacterium]|nr:HTTM domain-containing protein [Armatimonadota bacterium]
MFHKPGVTPASFKGASATEQVPVADSLERGGLWRELFGIDLRSVALFRIGLALMLLADLFMRSVDIEAFYTDRGVLPRYALESQWGGASYFSFHTLADSPASVGFLFGVNAIFVTLLLAGWKTRLVSVICWFFLISLQSRNGLVLQGGDIVLRCLAFWAMFLPLGDYLSLDAKTRFYPRLPGDDPARPVRAFSWGTVAIIVQTASIYWFTALLKNDPTWWQNGYAIYLALNIDLLTKPLGRFLVDIPFVAYMLTFATIYMEAFVPFVAFFPLRNGPVRTATVFLFWFFHLIALQSMMYLGPFPYVCALAWTVFLPSWFWDRITPWWLGGGANSVRGRLSRWASNYLPSRVGATSDMPARQPVRLGLPLPVNVLAAFYFFTMCIWNIRTVNFAALIHYFPVSMNRIAEVPHIDQCWDMFSPRPMSDDGWFVIAGTLRDGSKVDLMPWLADYGEAPPLSWGKPKEVGVQFRDERWRKYFLNLWPTSNKRFRRYLASYISYTWNRDHTGPRELCTFEIFYMREDTPDQYAPIPKPVPVQLWSHWCFEEFAPKAQNTVKPSPAPGVGEGLRDAQTGGK